MGVDVDRPSEPREQETGRQRERERGSEEEGRQLLCHSLSLSAVPVLLLLLLLLHSMLHHFLARYRILGGEGGDTALGKVFNQREGLVQGERSI